MRNKTVGKAGTIDETRLFMLHAKANSDITIDETKLFMLHAKVDSDVSSTMCDTFWD